METLSMQPMEISTPKTWDLFEAEYLVVNTAETMDVAKITEILAIPQLPLNRIIWVEEQICQLIDKKKKTSEMYVFSKRHLDRATQELPQLKTELQVLEAKMIELRDLKHTESAREDVSPQQLTELQAQIREIYNQIRTLRSTIVSTEINIKSFQIDIQKLGSGAETAGAEAVVLEEICLLVRQFNNDRRR